MAKYRKKPVIIEAEVYKPGMEDGFMCKMKYPSGAELDMPCLMNDCGSFEKCKLWEDKFPFIRTLEGNHNISKGDYIIIGIKSERYPCKPDIFEATYELAEE